MLIFNGDLLQRTTGFIIHGCNMLGVMGSGVARGVKTLHPRAFEVYIEQLTSGDAQLGDISVAQIHPELYIVNALTQPKYGGGMQVSYDAISKAFKQLQVFADTVDPLKRLGVAFPLIGAGRGGGDWAEIQPRILNSLGSPDGPNWRGRDLILYTVTQEPVYCR